MNYSGMLKGLTENKDKIKLMDDEERALKGPGVWLVAFRLLPETELIHLGIASAPMHFMPVSEFREAWEEHLDEDPEWVALLNAIEKGGGPYVFIMTPDKPEMNPQLVFDLSSISG